MEITAPRFRQITTPATHHSIFTGWMFFMMPNQQHQSTEDAQQNSLQLQELGQFIPPPRHVLPVL